eukprot:18663-Heterococcus_DN1.PRE.1
MVCCFSNHTPQTSLLPEASLGSANTTKAVAAQKTALAAANLRSVKERYGPCTVNDLEELIGCLVQKSAANGYKRLLPHTDLPLFFRPGVNDKHIKMLNESTHLQQATVLHKTLTMDETWRCFLGQQLMLLTELIIVCVPAYFQDNAKLTNTLGKRKSRGAVRSDMNLHSEMFVSAATKTDTSLTRSMALQYATLARVCDVQYGSSDTDLFLDMSGLQLPKECDVKTFFMLSERNMTPKGALLTACTDAIMQVQTAARLGRLPSMCSVLICITRSELQCLEQYTGTIIETPCISIAQLSTAAELTCDVIPKALALFIEAAADRGDVLHPYYGIQRVARCLLKTHEELSASAKNSINCRLKSIFNGYRALRYPVSEPLFQLLEGQHKLYQTQIRNQQAQDTSVSITRGARTVKGRLPAVEQGTDSVLQWKSSTEAMKQAMLNGTCTPFEAALEKGLIVHGSSIERFVKEASSMLRRRR